jgi:hypothetical protein
MVENADHRVKPYQLPDDVVRREIPALIKHNISQPRRIPSWHVGVECQCRDYAVDRPTQVTHSNRGRIQTQTQPRSWHEIFQPRPNSQTPLHSQFLL